MARERDNSIVELLLRDADISAFDEVLVRARNAGESAQRLGELEKDRAIALRLRETLLRHRRNEAELQLLNDTANDLAALRDLDSILQAISGRARRLLDCDLAYISLSDSSRGDSFIKAAAGNISGLLRGLRLPSGSGVGGIVARTGEPYAVNSYGNEKGFVHTNEIDRTVAAEHIESLLGVPVKLKQNVIGVLLAAHRSGREFSSRDIGVLAMLASHAAVAIENARLLDAAQEAVEELRVANTTVRGHVEELEHTGEVYERLTRLVIHGKGVEDVVAATTAAVSGDVLLLDERGDVVTASATTRTIPAGQLVDVGASAWRTGQTLVHEGLCAVPLITEAEPLGTLVLVTSGSIPDADRRILERAALVASLVLVTRRRVAEAEARVRGELLGELLDPRPNDYDLLRHRAALLGVDLDDCRILVVARIDGEPRDRVYAAIAALARRFHGLATFHHHTVVLFLPGEAPVPVARDVVRKLSGSFQCPVTAGAAMADQVTDIPTAHEEADHCLKALIALGRVGDVAGTQDLGFVGTILGGKAALGPFIDSVIGRVIDYDRGRRSDLVHTLDVYFRTGQHARNTARLLHLHANTVNQRLSRVGQLLGEDWRAPERLLEIQVALRLLKARACSES